MAVLALLVVANVIFVTLVLEAGLYYANIVTGVLDSSVEQSVFERGFKGNRLVVLPMTAAFMLAQYWYVRCGVLRSSSVQSDAPEVMDIEKRLTRLVA